MADLVWLAGQTASACGLVYGWYVAFTYCDRATHARTRGDKPALLHHLAMA
jgi:hypothetical protein